MGYTGNAPDIRTVGTMYITYKQARMHRAAVKEIVAKLRTSGCKHKDMKARDMRWEYHTCVGFWPQTGMRKYYVSLVGRAPHWWRSVSVNEQSVKPECWDGG